MPEIVHNPLMRIEQLAVSFGGPQGRVQAVDGMQLTVHPRQTVAVVGESGSGKSVTALSTLRLIPTPPGAYDSGHIWWWGDEHGEPDALPRDLLSLDERQMRDIRGDQIAMIFQEPMTSLNPVYTIGEQILEAILLHQQVTHLEAREITENALADVGIGDPSGRLKEYPHQLSGGMRQRVMIAMALACQPRLLLADEPTTALDVTIQAQILELLHKLQLERDMSIMLITHDLGVVAENADVVAVMYAGRVMEYAKVEALFARPLHPYTRGLLASIPIIGQRIDRLPTIADGAKAPDDMPAGFKVEFDLEQAQLGHHPEGAGLYEIEPQHWVLCRPTPDNASASPTAPDIAYRRPAVAARR